MRDNPKTFFNVNIVFEVSKDNEEKALEKILKIIHEKFNCSAIRIEQYKDRKYREVLIDAEFCRVIE